MTEQNPPTDDVREALARAIWDCDGDLESAVLEDCRGMADAILSDPRFEVRLRGTVTEPEEVWEYRADFSDGFTRYTRDKDQVRALAKRAVRVMRHRPMIPAGEWEPYVAEDRS